eukprot:scaffold174665_cov31-Tisochrysis_lutea.AAC.3
MPSFCSSCHGVGLPSLDAGKKREYSEAIQRSSLRGLLGLAATTEVLSGAEGPMPTEPAGTASAPRLSVSGPTCLPSSRRSSRW